MNACGLLPSAGVHRYICRGCGVRRPYVPLRTTLLPTWPRVHGGGAERLRSWTSPTASSTTVKVCGVPTSGSQR